MEELSFDQKMKSMTRTFMSSERYILVSKDKALNMQHYYLNNKEQRDLTNLLLLSGTTNPLFSRLL